MHKLLRQNALLLGVLSIVVNAPANCQTDVQIVNGGCKALTSNIWRFQSVDKILDSNVHMPSNTKMIVKFQDGYPVAISFEPKPSPTFVFVAEQAVWELPPDLLTGINEITHNFLATSDDKTGVTNANSVSVYLIPRQIIFSYPNTLQDQELSDAVNKRNIYLNKLNSTLLQDFRRERFNFFMTHSKETRKDLIAEQQCLSDKYKNLFAKK